MKAIPIDRVKWITNSVISQRVSESLLVKVISLKEYKEFDFNEWKSRFNDHFFGEVVLYRIHTMFPVIGAINSFLSVLECVKIGEKVFADDPEALAAIREIYQKTPEINQENIVEYQVDVVANTKAANGGFLTFLDVFHLAIIVEDFSNELDKCSDSDGESAEYSDLEIIMPTVLVWWEPQDFVDIDFSVLDIQYIHTLLYEQELLTKEDKTPCDDCSSCDQQACEGCDCCAGETCDDDKQEEVSQE